MQNCCHRKEGQSAQRASVSLKKGAVLRRVLVSEEVGSSPSICVRNSGCVEWSTWMLDCWKFLSAKLTGGECQHSSERQDLTPLFDIIILLHVVHFPYCTCSWTYFNSTLYAFLVCGRSKKPNQSHRPPTPKGQSPSGVRRLALLITQSSLQFLASLTVSSLCGFSHKYMRNWRLRCMWWRQESSTPITTLLRGQPKWSNTTSTHATDLHTGCLDCRGSTAVMHRSVSWWHRWNYFNLQKQVDKL